MSPDFEALMQQMSPEELEQLISLGSVDDRQKALLQQMAQAEALGQMGGERYSTPLGAALGGIGDVARGFASQGRLKDLQAQQQDLLSQQDDGRGLYVDILRRQQQGQQPVSPPIPFSF